MDKLTANRVMIITLLLLLLTCRQALCSENKEVDTIFDYAESLLEEGDYFRAIGEYKRYIFLYPTEERTQKAKSRIAEAFFRAKRWSDAILACNQFLDKYPDSPYYYDLLYLRGRAEKMDNRFADALRTFEDIAKRNVPNYSDKAVYQKALIMLERREWGRVKDFLMMVPRESPLFPMAQSFNAELEGIEKLPHKSPTYAGVLAAIVPGAGHLYTERPRDALVAFLLNATFIWAAVELIQHDNYVAGGIVSFFEVGWYTGNVYSAVNSAYKYNRDREDEFIKNEKDKFIISFQHDKDYSSIFLRKSF